MYCKPNDVYRLGPKGGGLWLLSTSLFVEMTPLALLVEVETCPSQRGFL